MQIFGKDYSEKEILYAYLNLCFQISTCQDEKYKDAKSISSIPEEDKKEVVRQMGVRALVGLQSVKDSEVNVDEEADAYLKTVEEVFADSAAEAAKAAEEAAADEHREEVEPTEEVKEEK